MNKNTQVKKLIPTLLLVLVFIVGYVYASSHDFFRSKKEDTPLSLLSLQEQDVNSFTITGVKDGSKVSFHKKNGQWEMTEPNAYPLNTYPVQDWLSLLTKVKAESVVEEQADHLEKYGLDKPEWTFEAIGADGAKHTIKIGNESPISGTYYALVNDQGKVYQVSESEWSGLKRSTYDFVLKEPITFPLERVEQFVWSYGGKTYTLNPLKESKPSQADKKQDTTTAGEGESDQAEQTEQTELDWQLQGKPITEDKASVLMNQFRDWSTNELPKQKKELMGGKPRNPDWKLELSLKPDEISSAEKKSYEGYVIGDKVWIIPQGEAWAFAVPKNAFDETCKAWIVPDSRVEKAK
ncbi:DUF4340 domain-containing protein [Paenibacillus alvei]|uniref:DUF4340 domain-containing protein n=1 Tax=Paenibacillus alvei TaxID=44250 RepID=A0AAP7DLC1_PAEAL|nr:DUF4340 domain-containing protein [Paenibacillus alvei]MBG9734601.1 hypothetical protein [Paenibacillus alvei]MBG9743088.1 hypothetical protein [Paenibacillus alvei]MCY9579619.1 DUF4340 domain-containing protein [Paenibacillus alvei]MCY9586579.1 DUF4340 domain-containing protein [Paenibacillus alvei]NOJ73626.1 DUF4340 domain-containing protein [Paenibacillus alvei]